MKRLTDSNRAAILVCLRVEGQPEFLGRCTATPLVKLDEEAYDPAQLDWFDLYRGPLKAGQLLASFELLEASSTSVAWLEFEGWGHKQSERRKSLCGIKEQSPGWEFGIS